MILQTGAQRVTAKTKVLSKVHLKTLRDDPIIVAENKTRRSDVENEVLFNASFDLVARDSFICRESDNFRSTFYLQFHMLIDLVQLNIVIACNHNVINNTQLFFNLKVYTNASLKLMRKLLIQVF